MQEQSKDTHKLHIMSEIRAKKQVNSLAYATTMLLGLNWICNGLIINLLQLLLYLTVRPFSISMYRKFNYYLIYSSWCQMVAIAEHVADCRITLYFADDESEQHFGREHCLSVMNHKYELDWLYCWLAMEKRGALASSKSFMKKSLKWVPIIGWCFYFGEMIFLERSWEKDQRTIGQSLDRLMDYKECVNLLLFAEGTRFTKEKYENSVAFAKERGLQILKHHLVPRTRGFNYTVKHVKDRMPAIYNIQIDFPTDKDANKPSVSSLLYGKHLHGHMYVERIPISKVPTESDDKLNDFLFDLYRRKDGLSEYFQQKQEYPSKLREFPKKSLTPLLNLLFWVFVISASWISFIYLLFAYKCYYLLIGIIVVGGLFGVAALSLLVSSSRSSKGSSYGVKKQKHDGGDDKSDDADSSIDESTQKLKTN